MSALPLIPRVKSAIVFRFSSWSEANDLVWIPPRISPRMRNVGCHSAGTPPGAIQTNPRTALTHRTAAPKCHVYSTSRKTPNILQNELVERLIVVVSTRIAHNIAATLNCRLTYCFTKTCSLAGGGHHNKSTTSTRTTSSCSVCQ